MFQKQKKTTVEFTYGLEGHSGSSRTVPLKDGELYEHLKELRKRHGELVIEFTSDDTIHVTSTESVKHKRAEDKLEDIEKLIKQYIKGEAIEMTAYAVFAKGVLKGVFDEEVKSRFKRTFLLREGFTEEDIEIQPIQVGSMENIK